MALFSECLKACIPIRSAEHEWLEERCSQLALENERLRQRLKAQEAAAVATTPLQQHANRRGCSLVSYCR